MGLRLILDTPHDAVFFTKDPLHCLGQALFRISVKIEPDVTLQFPWLLRFFSQ